jgi:aspartate beta-hydroxylase
MGLSRFSASIAVQFIASKLKTGEQHKFSKAVQYLLSLLNNKPSAERSSSNSGVHRCPQLVPGLHGSPFWDTAALPWIAQLEASFDDIKREFLALKEMPNRKVASGFQHYRSPKHNGSAADHSATEEAQLGESATDRGHWNVCYFHLHGVDFGDNLERCPLTAAAIAAVPRQYRHALFSALAPDTHVKPHCGPTNKKLRCHLPLCVPRGGAAPSAVRPEEGRSAPSTSWLRVGEEYRALEEGKCVLFDDSFEHEACNTSLTEPRVVLIIDVWHPDLSDEEVRPYLRLSFVLYDGVLMPVWSAPLLQVKFFEFINNAQIKAAQRMSAALRREAELAAAASCSSAASGAGTPQPGEAPSDREDFFHVIQAAKERGIGESDAQNIWSS